ncbi:DNA/RNA helicase domain-containing protein [Mycoplasma sp. P36-A1]|uniref:DNA/RNA helicase domain-containing protein n=1 Tax=Mycoplasma sp. P36-A1 TaxID=3252900 RepID=UPI003C2AC859
MDNFKEFNINKFDFNLDSLDTQQHNLSIKYTNNYPMLYLLTNNKEIYIGESANIKQRLKTHLNTKEKGSFKEIFTISNEEFNKSAALHYESMLIEYAIADDKYATITNSNYGQSHNYYQREVYAEAFEDLWNILYKKKIFNQEYTKIQESELFKFSPYKSLNEEQSNLSNEIFSVVENAITNNRKTVICVSGLAGTGKSILALNIVRILSEYMHDDGIILEDKCLSENIIENNDVKLVVPNNNLLKTYKNLFSKVSILNKKDVVSPTDFAKNYSKIIIVDEAHRLKKRYAITNYLSHDNTNRKLNLGKEGTQLDWIMNNSLVQIFFYDSKQSVLPSDVDNIDFEQLFSKQYNELDFDVHKFEIRSQMRVKAGQEYSIYIDNILSNNNPSYKEFDNYEFKIIDDFKTFVEVIKDKNKKFGISRIISGYAFKWKSKKPDIPDIEIDGIKLYWNKEVKKISWLDRESSIEEVGSIHTIQGFDLNYTGLIIGNDLKYDPVNKKLIADKNNYYDSKGKMGVNNDKLLEYIINIYQTLLTRGVYGTYLYICDKNLKEYLKQYIETYKGSI